MESLSFILSVTFTAIIWIAVFGVCILCIIRNKFCSKEDKSQKYLAKPKDIEMDPKNHSEESRRKDKEKKFKLEEGSKPLATDLSMMGSLKNDSKLITDHYHDTSSFQMNVIPANRDNYIGEETLNVKKLM